MKIFGFIMLFLLAAAASYADVSIYLFPRVDRGRSPLSVSDLGTIDGDAEAAAVRSLAVDDALYADGYIDRRELVELVRPHVDGRVNVYGSGVRVSMAENGAVKEEPRIVVRKGSPVRFQVVNSIIRVEQSGTALQDGAVGDEIQVKLKGSAVSRGRIVNERVVELTL
ncbi:MAG TPA: flagella basal body P-ring formation protein FlgA [Spirochaetota bacterium]|nr:flagella basal body P-ring formation protein FlgA [Spirochaetota bacterium]